MAGVESLFIYWPERHNLGLGRQFQQIHPPRKPPGRISPGHLGKVWQPPFCKKPMTEVAENLSCFPNHID